MNGHRVTSTTAVRQAGGAVLINFHAVASPYRLAAIGNPAALRRGVLRSDIAGRFQAWREIYGLGFEVRPVERLEVSGIGAPAAPTWARPAEAAA